MWKRRLGWVGGASALAVGAAAVMASSLGWMGPPYTFEVPLATWPGYEYFYLAKRQGLDQRVGVRMETPDYPDLQAIVHAYLRGELDAPQLTTVEAVPMPMGEMAGRLARGEVDGAAFFPPFSDYALRLALLQPRLQP
jgi:hypothetical protein